MKCTVRLVAKNVRYRVLAIKEEQYILDMGGGSLWKMLCPFLYWLLPNHVYKLENPEIVKELTAPAVKNKVGSSPFLWTIVASIMASTLSPLANYFEIGIPKYMNVIIVAFIMAFIIFLLSSLNRMFRKKMDQLVNLHRLTKGHI